LAIINQNVEHVKREQQSTKDKFESNILPHVEMGNQETDLMKSDSETSQIRNSIDRTIQSSRSAPSNVFNIPTATDPLVMNSKGDGRERAKDKETKRLKVILNEKERQLTSLHHMVTE
jgi:hypothetical protein